jgi:ABC-type sugar transport system ATPase subunit
MADAGLDASATAEEEVPVVKVTELNFAYDRSMPTVLHDVSLTLRKGDRLLLVGDNGAGKTTLMKLMAGSHRHPMGSVLVLGRESFFDTGLESHRSFMASDWGRHTVAFSGYG